MNLKTWRKNFFLIWTGQAVSQFSSSVLQFAIVWYLTDQTGSALVLTAAMMMGFLPQGLLGPVVGVLIDRYDRKKMMIFSDLFIAAASFFLVLADWMGFLSTGLILIVLMFRSIGTAFHAPCLQAVTPQIVPKEELTKCAGYSQALESVSLILSPAAAAVLYQSWDLSGIIFLDVLGALLAVLTLIPAVIPKLSVNLERGKIRLLQEAKDGFSVLRTKKGMLALVLIGSLYTVALMPTSALFPLMCMSYFGGTSTNASIAEVVFSVGLLAGSLLLARWGGTKNRIYTIVGSFLLMSFSLFWAGMLKPDGFTIFVFCSWLMGVSGPFYWGMFTPLLQSHFEPEYLGRVFSLSASIRLLSGPLGLAVSGFIAEQFGVQWWFLVAGGVVLVAAGLCIALPAVRHCDQRVADDHIKME